MTERYGPGYGEEGGQRPSGRGAVTERLARQDHANEIDLTDETTERESSGAFEPASPGGPVGDAAAETGRTGSANIFDVDERARQEDQNRTGYEPSVADPGADPGGPRGESVVTEPGEPRDDPDPAPTAEDASAEEASAEDASLEDAAAEEAYAEAEPADVSRPRSPSRRRHHPADVAPAAETPVAAVLSAARVAGRRRHPQPVPRHPGRVYRRAAPGGRGGRPLRRRPLAPGGRRPSAAARPARRGDRGGLDRGPAPGPAGLPAVRRPAPGPGRLSQTLSLGVEEEYRGPGVGGGSGDLRDRPLRWRRATTRRPGEPGGPG